MTHLGLHRFPGDRLATPFGTRPAGLSARRPVGMIAPIVPPDGSLHEPAPDPAAPAAPPAVTSGIVYGTCTVGEAGRVMDRAVFGALGWSPGTRLSITVADRGVLLAVPQPGGPVAVRDGFVRIPFRLRRRAGLGIGDRVLLVGAICYEGLAIHAPQAMADVLAPTLRLLEQVSR
jgi:hypothetical protein